MKRIISILALATISLMASEVLNQEQVQEPKVEQEINYDKGSLSTNEQTPVETNSTEQTKVEQEINYDKGSLSTN